MQEVITKIVGYTILITIFIIKRLLLVAIIYGLLNLYGKPMYTYVELSVLYLIVEFTLTGINGKLSRINETVNKVIEETLKTE